MNQTIGYQMIEKETQIYGYPKEDVPRLCLFTIKLYIRL